MVDWVGVDGISKPLVIMNHRLQTPPETIGAAIIYDALEGFAVNHPKLGSKLIRTSKVLNMTYDSTGITLVETKNTIYLVEEAGWAEGLEPRRKFLQGSPFTGLLELLGESE